MQFRLTGKETPEQIEKRRVDVLARIPEVSWRTRKLVIGDCLRATTSGRLLDDFEARLFERYIYYRASGGDARKVLKDFDRNFGTIQAICRRDERLQQLLEIAREMGRVSREEILEDAAYERAVEGVDVPVFHKGKKVATKKQYSDTLLTTMLKAHSPDRYADRSVVQHGGTVLQLHIEGVRDKPAVDVTPTSEDGETTHDKSRPGETVLQVTSDDAEHAPGETDASGSSGVPDGGERPLGDSVRAG